MSAKTAEAASDTALKYWSALFRQRLLRAPLVRLVALIFKRLCRRKASARAPWGGLPNGPLERTAQPNMNSP
eukprot:6924467-Alexandrium_andersonii.AAC.1